MEAIGDYRQFSNKYRRYSPMFEDGFPTFHNEEWNNEGIHRCLKMAFQHFHPSSPIMIYNYQWKPSVITGNFLKIPVNFLLKSGHSANNHDDKCR